jgi:CubicO group peptidase (beta-lactamase class C family)
MPRLRLASLIAVVPLTLGAQQSDLPARIDRIFARFDRTTPGCAVGLGKDGRALYTQGYGSANLEYRIPLTDSSVMESGSVAKQFTAASLVLLQQDGKLSLDDDIRKYLPEVPDFGHPITIRNLLTHTSGLRDQWGLLGIEGRGPGTQVHSLATTLDLVVHQKMLNFPPGSEYLYSNTGYALAAIIIQRVSGKSLQDFTQERLFRPLGMTHTQWRDDFTRVVPNRATAYEPVRGGGYRQDMPFTNMVGNGGVLSTMSDLLKWNENLDHPVVGGPTFTTTLETRMRLTSGRTIPYALGLINGEHNGVREVSHSGSTAGYRTFLARYPEQHVSVAVWCSNASANPTSLAHQVVDLVLARPQRAAVQAGAPAVRLGAAESAKFGGVYRDAHTDHVIALSAGDTALTTTGAAPFVPVSATRFRTGTSTAEFVSMGPTKRFVVVNAGGDSSWYDAVKPAPATVPTADYVGRYVSDELDVELDVVARDGKLFVNRRPDDSIELRPTYADGFQGAGLGSVRFARDARGAIEGFSIYAGRVLDVRFKRAR